MIIAERTGSSQAYRPGISALEFWERNHHWLGKRHTGDRQIPFDDHSRKWKMHRESRLLRRHARVAAKKARQRTEKIERAKKRQARQ